MLYSKNAHCGHVTNINKSPGRYRFDDCLGFSAKNIPDDLDGAVQLLRRPYRLDEGSIYYTRIQSIGSPRRLITHDE
jgi:hypothetical protein